MLAVNAPSSSLARSESFTRSKISPRLVKVSGNSPVPASAHLHIPNSEYAQTENINLRTERPFVLSQAPRGSPQSAKTVSGKAIAFDRPDTSGGSVTLPSWNQTQWEQPRKNRISRDDTYLDMAKNKKVEPSEMQGNKFTMTTALPTPDATPPRGPSPEEPLPEILLEMNEHNQYGLGIGLAMGSPAHPSKDWSQTPYLTNTGDQVPEPEQQKEVVSPMSSGAKQKTKWKGFGSLFGRKPSKPFYQLDEPQKSEGNTSNGNSTPPDSADSRIRGRSNTTAKKSARQPPAPTRSNTTPADKNGWTNKLNNRNQKPPEIHLDGGPMLDVEIPSIHLDRYSVMFSGVLGKGGMDTSSNLLARRQATLDKLKTVNEAIAEKEREELEIQRKLRLRSATSPQPAKSPAFSLFPTTVGTTNHQVPRTPSPQVDHLRPQYIKLGLSRSNTSPAALSPNRSTFNSDAESHIIMFDDGKSILNGISIRAAKKNVQFSAQESTLMLSPQSMDSSSRRQSLNGEFSRLSNSSSETSDLEDEDEVHVREPLKPKLKEPDWKIIKPSGPESIKNNPFSKEIELIEEISKPALGRGRSRTITEHSSTTVSSKEPSPNPEMRTPHPMSPLGSNPPTSPVPILTPISQQTTSNMSLNFPQPPNRTPSNSTTNDIPRRARSIKEIRADLEIRQRSAQREQQRAVERAKVQADLDEAERTLESAAELSIARQISVSQRQRQLLLPTMKPRGPAHAAPMHAAPSPPSINPTPHDRNDGGDSSRPAHRKALSSTSSSNTNSSVLSGLGASRETDAMLLSSGGFNNPNPVSSSPYSHPRTAPSVSSSISSLENGGGFDFNHYERGDRDRAMGAATRTAGQGREGEIKGKGRSRGEVLNTINKTMGMGAVKKEVVGGVPLIVQPELVGLGEGRGMGHRYQRSERVVLEN